MKEKPDRSGQGEVQGPPVAYGDVEIIDPTQPGQVVRSITPGHEYVFRVGLTRKADPKHPERIAPTDDGTLGGKEITVTFYSPDITTTPSFKQTFTTKALVELDRMGLLGDYVDFHITPEKSKLPFFTFMFDMYYRHIMISFREIQLPISK